MVAGCRSVNNAPLAGPLEPQRMNLSEFERLHSEQSVAVVDVRGLQEYQSGHIPGAVFIPLDAVQQYISYLQDLERPIVTYCG